AATAVRAAGRSSWALPCARATASATPSRGLARSRGYRTCPSGTSEHRTKLSGIRSRARRRFVVTVEPRFAGIGDLLVRAGADRDADLVERERIGSAAERRPGRAVGRGRERQRAVGRGEPPPLVGDRIVRPRAGEQ